ncbi:MAG: hypothetical protein Q9227_001525 [Pyrenula ochraceoflavens]
MSSMTPLAGRLCKIFAPRHYIFVSTLLMCIGLLVTGYAPTLAVFLLGRALTGMGGSAIYTVSTIVAVNLSSPRRRGLFIGLVNTGYTIGVSAGAVVSGALDAAVGWRAIFWLQIPIAIIAVTGAFLAIPAGQLDNSKQSNDDSTSQKLRRVDYPGLLTLALSVVLFLYGLSAAKIQILPILLSLITFPTFVLTECYYASEPIIPVLVLKSRGMLLTCLSTVGFMMARWAVLFYTPVYTISVRDWSKASGGLILVPTNVGFAIGGLLVGWLHIRSASSYYGSCILVYGLFVVSLYILSRLSTATSPVGAYIVAAFVNGFITGTALNYTMAHVLHLMPLHSHPIVVSLLAMFRGLAGSFGSAIGGGFFLRVLKRRLEAGFDAAEQEDLIRRLLGSPALVRTLAEPEKGIARDAYGEAVRMLFLAGCGIGLVVTAVQAGTGWKAPLPEQQDGEEEEDEEAEEEEEESLREEVAAHSNDAGQ